MRPRLTTLVLLVVLLTGKTSPAQQTSAPVQRDQQALTILSQVLNAAGGQSAVGAIQDFKATGNVTYNWGGNAQGSTTVKGRGLHQFRVDTTLPDGLHSWIVNGGTTFQRNPDGSTSPLPSQNTVKPAPITFPLLQLLAVIQDTTISVIYNGLVMHNGQQVHDVLVQKKLSSSVDPVGAFAQVTKADVFIDPNALTIQAIADVAYPRDSVAGQCAHEIQFSGYQSVNGVLVPFSVTELIAGQQTATIQLNQITFNNSLTDSDFE